MGRRLQRVVPWLTEVGVAWSHDGSYLGTRSDVHYQAMKLQKEFLRMAHRLYSDPSILGPKSGYAVPEEGSLPIEPYDSCGTVFLLAPWSWFLRTPRYLTEVDQLFLYNHEQCALPTSPQGILFVTGQAKTSQKPINP